MKTIHPSPARPHLRVGAWLTALTTFTFILSAALAATTPGRPQRLDGPDAVPEGLSAPDWSSIRQQYEQHRHRAFPVEGAPGTLQARNPGQQWQTRFDGRGFTTQPNAAGWQWGLELRSYGFAGHEQVVASQPRVSTMGQRVVYDWDEVLQEWFINDARGLEHGFTVCYRPPEPSTPNAQLSTPLTFTLAVRGGLRPEVQADGRGVRFVDGHGATALTYAGLTVLDADGRSLPARFEAAEGRAGSPQPPANGDKARPTPRRGEDTAPYHECGLRISIDERGARYPLTVDPIAQQAYLKSSNSEGTPPGELYGDHFGYSVAVSGDTVVVGAPAEDSDATGVNGNQGNNSVRDSGAAYVFVRTGTSWKQQAYLKGSSLTVLFWSAENDRFGASVAVSGDTVVVGAPQEASNAKGVDGNQYNEDAGYSGAAYVFVRTGTSWSQQAYLKASNTGAADNFGYSVAVAGDTVVVGAYGEDSDFTGVQNAPFTDPQLAQQNNDGAHDSGAAYVFVRSGTSWSQQAYLKASNTAIFGYSVAVWGDTVVIGAPWEPYYQSGAAYVFVRTGTSWSQQAHLKASNRSALDVFGASVGVSGDTVVVGAPEEDSDFTGVQNAPFTAPQLAQQNNDGATSSGAAYVFVRTGTLWSQQAYLKASNTGKDDLFGGRVAVSGDTIVVGASGEDSGSTGSGAAYVFVRSGTSWSQQAYLKASNTGKDDQFGGSVAVGGDTVVVGAIQEDSNFRGVQNATFTAAQLAQQNNNSAPDSGAAYIFTDLIILVAPPSPTISIEIVQNCPPPCGRFSISFFSRPHFIYCLYRAPSVTGPWIPLVTLTAPASGVIEYHDTNAPAGQAFYRTVLLRPPNDAFANATPINALPAMIFASNFYATKETGETNHAGNAGGNSLWWSWTALSEDRVTISTIGSDFDTLLAVYVGDSNQLGLVTADDDGGGNFTSRLTFNAQAGATYQIAVDGYNGDSGNIQLNLTMP